MRLTPILPLLTVLFLEATANNPYAFIVKKFQVPPLMLSAATIVTHSKVLSVEYPISFYDSSDLCVLTSHFMPAKVSKYRNEECLSVFSVIKIDDAGVLLITLTRPITFHYGVSVANLAAEDPAGVSQPVKTYWQTFEHCRLFYVGMRLRYRSFEFPERIVSIEMVVDTSMLATNGSWNRYFIAAPKRFEAQNEFVKKYEPDRYSHSWKQNGSPLFCRDAMVGMLFGNPYGCVNEAKPDYLVSEFDCQTMKSRIEFGGTDTLGAKKHALSFVNTIPITARYNVF